MATDSREPGFLAPGDSPVYDQALEDIFQDLIVGITGLQGRMVRPRWQADPPTQPQFDQDWVAFGVRVVGRQWDAYKHFDPNLGPEGSYVVEGDEPISLLCSFYGPNYQALQRRFEDGLQIEQHRTTLNPYGIKFQSLQEPVVLPALMKEQWVKRVDVKAAFTRWCRRVYPILTIQRADVDIHTETLVERISVLPPSP